MSSREYAEPAKPRPRVTPPHIELAALRNALGLKQADVLAEMSKLLDRPFTAGALSGIERGHRGASPQVLSALEVALGLRAGDLVTDYEPGHTRMKEPA